MKDKTLSTIYLILVWIFISSVFLYGAISMATALNTPYSLSGHVYDDASNPLVGANITFTNMNSSEVIYYDSTSGGEYQQDAANFVSGYFDSDIIRYYTVYSGYTNTTNASINVTEGGTTLDIYVTLPGTPHLQNNTNYYISYYYTVGITSTWGNMSNAVGNIGEDSVSLIGAAIILLVVFATLDFIFIKYLWDKKE